MAKTNKQRWPEYVYRAFASGCYGGFGEEDLETFTKRWKDPIIETFERVLREGRGGDKVIAIFALGYANVPQTRSLLLPLLESDVRRERWASAYALGKLHEEQALPVLHRCLQEARSAPSVAEAFEDENLWLDTMRIDMSSLLGNWGQLSSIPVLRSALKVTWEWEQLFLAGLPDGSELEMITPWEEYEYELAYALGQLGAFGALTGIVLSPSRQRVLAVHLASGALQLHKKETDFFTLIVLDTSVQKELAKVLEHRFGHSEAEQTKYIQQFPHDYFREGMQAPKPFYGNGPRDNERGESTEEKNL